VKQKINNLPGIVSPIVTYFVFTLFGHHFSGLTEGRLIGDRGTDTMNPPRMMSSAARKHSVSLFCTTDLPCATATALLWVFSAMISYCREKKLVCISSARQVFAVSLQWRFLAFSAVDEFVRHRKQWGFLCLRNDVSWGLPWAMLEFRISDTNFRNQ
jgi:hypothetical protein